MWVWPQTALWSPPPLAVNIGGPFSPVPLCAMLQEGRPHWRGGGGAQKWRVEGEGPSSGIWARPTSGPFDLGPEKEGLSKTGHVWKLAIAALTGFFSGKKKEPKPKLFGLDICEWGGGPST